MGADTHKPTDRVLSGAGKITLKNAAKNTPLTIPMPCVICKIIPDQHLVAWVKAVVRRYPAGMSVKVSINAFRH